MNYRDEHVSHLLSKRTRSVLGTALTTLAAILIAMPSSGASGSPQMEVGFDASGMDRSISPGDDFYAYANGKWLARTSIPADKSEVGVFDALDDATDARVFAILEDASREVSKMGIFYNSYLDAADADAKGFAPLGPWAAEIGAARDKSALLGVMAKLQRNGVDGLVDIEIAADPRLPTTYVIRLHQSGTPLPDRAYYLGQDAEAVKSRAAYLAYLSAMLKLAGGANADERAQAVLDFETKLAKAHWDGVDRRNDDKTYNPQSMAELTAKAPGLDWTAYLDRLGLTPRGDFIVNEPSALSGEAAAWGASSLPVLKDWLLLEALDKYAALLSKPFADTRFAFFGGTLSGAAQMPGRQLQAARLVSREMRDAIGQEYARRYFSPAEKAAVEQMVQNITAAFRNHLRRANWLTPATREKAIAKLDNARVLIGYPDHWRDYASLDIRPHDLVGNVARAEAYEWDHQLRKLGTPVDRSEWSLDVITAGGFATANLVNIGFPAAMLQAPVFDPKADPAVNYGAAGVIIGHELSHLFDDQGRKHDVDGQLTQWWSAPDVAEFDRRANRLIAQYDAYTPLPGLHINGSSTQGENLADLIGLQIALDGYHLSLAGKQPPQVGDFSGDQLFFLGLAQMQRAKYRDAALRQQVVSNVHSPAQQRVDGVRNVQAWYDAFNVKPGGKLYLVPAERVVIW